MTNKVEIQTLNKGDEFTIIGKGRKKKYEFWGCYTINGEAGVCYYDDNNPEKTKIRTSKKCNQLVIKINKNDNNTI